MVNLESRIFKFRAWLKPTKQMARVTGIDFEHSGTFRVLTPDSQIIWFGQVNISAVLMQFTGLTDKNGKEIYDGDVLYYPMQGKRVVYYPFNERVASYGLREISTGMCSTLQDSHRVYEIIGNRFENPELLEEVTV